MKKNILIVEDHELTRFGLKTTFENVDFVENLYEADSAETAIQIFNNNNIDIIITSLSVTKYLAMTLFSQDLSALKSLGSKSITLPILFTSVTSTVGL